MPPVSRMRTAWLLAGTVALAVAGGVVGGASASAALSPGRATRTVSYLGHRFTVPAAWPVVSLATNPRECVRFNRHAVYLGTPGAASACPSHVLGTSDALLLQPAAPGTAPAASADTVSHQITVTGGGIRAEAAYASSPAAIDAVLASGGLSVPVARPPASRSLVKPRLIVPKVAASATDYTGEGFDPCSAPDSGTMNAWKSNSPYGAIGVYIGGVNRGCAQPNLTASWVSAQAANGWRFFPLYVGPEAAGACSGCVTITSPASQAQAAAQDAANQAASLGFGPGSLIVYDMEAYSSSQESLVLSFMSDWTNDLHALGYRSGEYSSLSSGITDLVNNVGNYTMPDVIDFADWNGQATTSSSGIPASLWVNHQRIHQYSGGVNQTYGGVTINVDQDYLDVQLAGPPPGSQNDASSVMDSLGNSINSQVVENGILCQTVQNLSTGAWQNACTGIPVTGAVSSVYDGTDHTIKTQVVENGVLHQVIQNLDTGAWVDNSTGIAVTGAVSSVMDSLGNSINSQVVENGILCQTVQNLSTGAWQNACTGIPVTGAVSSVYDGTDHTIKTQVVENGVLHQVIQNLDTGAWVDNSTGIAVTGAVSSVMDSLGNSINSQVVENGILCQTVQNLSTGAWQNACTGIPVTGAVSSVYDGTDHTIKTQVVENGVLHQVIQNLDTGAWVDNSTGISVDD